MWGLGQRHEVLPSRLLPQMPQGHNCHQALAEALGFQKLFRRSIHAGQARELIQSDYFIFAKQRLMEIIPVKQKVQNIPGTDGRNRLRALGQTLHKERSPSSMEEVAAPELKSLCKMERDDTDQQSQHEHDFTDRIGQPRVIAIE